MSTAPHPFSEKRILYNTVMEDTFDISTSQILLKASRINNLDARERDNLNLKQFCENQILGVLRHLNGDWHTLSYKGEIPNIDTLSTCLLYWPAQLQYSKKLSNHQVEELFNEENPLLDLISQLLPGHNHTTNNKKRLHSLLAHNFKYHIPYSSRVSSRTQKEVVRLI